MSNKVLIIEDEKSLSSALSDKLRLEGYEVEVAEDGEEGLVKAISNKPDLILLDIIMPKKNGLEVIEDLRDNEWGKNAKIILLTNLSDLNMVAEATSKHVFTCLVKSNHDLESIVREIKAELS